VTTFRLLRLYRSDKGVWRYDLERDGVVRYSSLRTRDERKARADYERIKACFDRHDGSVLDQARGK
jgi:hypothetical protein